MTKRLTYSIHELVPYINWLYFDYAWGMSGKPQADRQQLRSEAEKMLCQVDGKYEVKALFRLCRAFSDGDDLLLDDIRLPLLRQQSAADKGGVMLCLADFVRPISAHIPDKVGVFATTVDIGLETDFAHDDYLKMLSQTLADRLAEAAAEKLHQEVRTLYWGYAPDEHLSMKELHAEKFQGIRPAVGYPSMPDASVNFILSDLLGLKDIGVRLTENGAMKPHASVTGLMLAHPDARYFELGAIGSDQLADYARRRGVPVELMKRFLASNLLK